MMATKNSKSAKKKQILTGGNGGNREAASMNKLVSSALLEFC
jgi:hypothetical protein